MTITANGNAPYTSPSSVITVIERYRERGLQTPFTTEVLVKAGVTEGLAPRTLQALELLDLIDGEGEPTEQFTALRQATQDDFRERFAALLRGAYAEVFSFIDPSQDSRERVRDAFRSYKPYGQQERMVTLFLGLCEYAGIVDQAPRRSVAAAPARPSRERVRVEKRQPSRVQVEPVPVPGILELGLRHEGSMQAGAHPLIQGLLRELPPVGGNWPTAKHRAWLELQRAAFRLLFTIEENSASATDEFSPQPDGGESD